MTKFKVTYLRPNIKKTSTGTVKIDGERIGSGDPKKDAGILEHELFINAGLTGKKKGTPETVKPTGGLKAAAGKLLQTIKGEPKTEGKLLQTKDLSIERAEIEPRPPVPGPRTSGWSDRDFIARFASDEEARELRKKIESRAAATPRHSYWKCPNPKCRGRIELPGYMKGPLSCHSCNQPGYKDFLGWLVPMNDGEIKKFLADRAAGDAKWRSPEQKSKREAAWQTQFQADKAAGKY